MNALIFSLPIVLTVIYIILPIFQAVALSMGLDLAVSNEIVILAVQAGISVIVLTLMSIFKSRIGRTGRILLLLDLPLVLLNALVFADPQSAWALLPSVISVACVFACFMFLVPDNNFKATSVVFSVLIAICFVGLTIWNLVISGAVDSEVRSTVTSPNGEYNAVIVSESSILGDSMVVRIEKVNPELNLVLGELYVPEKEIYEGEGYEVETAKVYWKDDNTVVINDVEYSK